MTTSTAPGAQVQIVPITLAVAEVRITTGGAPGQHRPGRVVEWPLVLAAPRRCAESPVAESRSAAATLLADYHRAFKPPPASAPVRRLLFAQA